MCTLQRELLLLTLIAFPKKKMKKDLLLFLLKIVHCTSVQASDSGIMYKSKNAAELRRPFLLKFLCFAHYWATWMLKNLALT